ncbi:MAG TPA: DUF4149 domain-containing protein [Bacillota bacterium]|nr:DUF4149 domain-containing protein [Bacillota bacterium]
MNAAVWFGAAVFFTLGVEPAISSQEMKSLLGQKYYPFFSVAIAQILSARFFQLYLVCTIVALMHLLVQWLYFGRYPQRFWLWLILGLCVVGLADGYWLQPWLKELHRLQFTRPELRQAASRTFNVWYSIARGLHLLLAVGLGAYFWRLANPTDTPRFTSTAKFRS